MAEHLLVAVAELGNALHRGDLVRPDHPLAIAQPSHFQPYKPPVPAMADGTPVRAKTVVARESFAAGDVVVRLGELHDPRAPVVRRAPAFFVPFAPPAPILRKD